MALSRKSSFYNENESSLKILFAEMLYNNEAACKCDHLVRAFEIATGEQEDVAEFFALWFEALDPFKMDKNGKEIPLGSLFSGKTAFQTQINCGHPRKPTEDMWSCLKLPFADMVQQKRAIASAEAQKEIALAEAKDQGKGRD